MQELVRNEFEICKAATKTLPSPTLSSFLSSGGEGEEIDYCLRRKNLLALFGLRVTLLLVPSTTTELVTGDQLITGVRLVALSRLKPVAFDGQVTTTFGATEAIFNEGVAGGGTTVMMPVP